jgi:hypothetical protein
VLVDLDEDVVVSVVDEVVSVPWTPCVVVVSLWVFDSERVGVGVGVGVLEDEESVGVGVLLVVEDELGVVVGVGVGVDDELLGVVFAAADDEGVVDAAAVPNNPPAKPLSAVSTPPSRSFFSMTSRRAGFESNQLACASATKTVARVKPRNCCLENIIFAMVLCV